MILGVFVDFSILKSAFIDILENTIQITPEEIPATSHSGYLSSIELIEMGIISYANYSQEFLKIFSKIMLGDENPSQDMIQDIANECCNLITGRAKMLMESSATLSIPKHYGYIDTPQTYDHSFSFLIKPNALVSLYIEIKEDK